MMCAICDKGAGWGLLILGTIGILKSYGVLSFNADILSILLVLMGIAKIMCGSCPSCMVVQKTLSGKKK